MLSFSTSTNNNENHTCIIDDNHQTSIVNSGLIRQCCSPTKCAGSGGWGVSARSRLALCEHAQLIVRSHLVLQCKRITMQLQQLFKLDSVSAYQIEV